MSKIAVHCPTKKLFGKVMKKLGSNRDINRWDKKGEDTHLEISPVKDEFDGKHCFVRDGYKIISAAEYLNGGGKDVSEFKKGDRVECIEGDSPVKEGEVYTVRTTYDGGTGLPCIKVDGCEYIGFLASKFKLATKTQTTKENKMKSNDINKNVAAVFSNKSGEELLLVDKHYDRDMMDRILMETHKVAILKACKTAEAELLKEDK